MSFEDWLWIVLGVVAIVFWAVVLGVFDGGRKRPTKKD